MNTQYNSKLSWSLKGLVMSMALLFMTSSIGLAQEVVSISSAKDSTDGTTVTVSGIVTTPDHGNGYTQFYIQDETAGINIYYGDSKIVDGDGNPVYSAGDSVTVTGALGAYNGLRQLEVGAEEDITQNATGMELPESQLVEPSWLTGESEYQSSRVMVKELELVDASNWPTEEMSGSGVNVQAVQTSTEDTIAIRISNHSYYNGTPAPEGKFNITAVVGTYYDAQLFPFFEGDIVDITGMVEVNFQVNTSTVGDTLKAGDFVQVRGGGLADTTTKAITWDSSSEVVMDNQGGDYWSGSLYMTPGDTLDYKYWAGLIGEDTTGVPPNGGWEQNHVGGDDSDNRILVVPDNDTTIHEYYNKHNSYNPFTDTPVADRDSVGVKFRVNVGAAVQQEAFDTTGIGTENPPVVQVRGGTADGAPIAPLTWADDTGVELTFESMKGNNIFFSGVGYFHKDTLAKYEQVEYKFYAGEWEEGDNRIAVIPTDQDTTMRWKFFNREAPAGQVISSNISFSVNVGVLESLTYEGTPLFDSSMDQVVTRGSSPLGWGTEDANSMSFDSEDKVWSLTREFTMSPQSTFPYKYYIDYGDERTDPESENYLAPWDENEDFGYEEPVTTGGADRIFQFGDSETQSTGTEYFNGLNAAAVILQEDTPNGSLQVHFHVDMEPATNNDEQPFDPETHNVYLQMESKITALTQGFPSGANYLDETPTDSLEFLRFTDDNDDLIYDLTLDLRFPTLNDFGFVIRYEDPDDPSTSPITNGGGFDPGRRYYKFIQPSSVEMGEVDENLGQLYNVEWPGEAHMDTVTWKAEDLPFDVQPDYDEMATDIQEEYSQAPERFKLSQNYPNPFNPSTKIDFTLPQTTDVTLRVYNVLGQQVKTLVNERMSAGSHSARFDATGLSSGMYFYRLQAGDYTAQKQMMLIK